METSKLTNDRKKKYEELLALVATKDPTDVFDTPDGPKALYILDDNIARAFPVAEVDRKKSELQLGSD